mmetsp:Transcript_31946/g.55041  ORF Transcript_31946/g.55041 Transcript_31946/m.55041 type:complete len:317 (+) Transcript_31946:22-972(+)
MLLKKFLGSVFLCLHLLAVVVVYIDFVCIEYLPTAIEGDFVSQMILVLFHFVGAFQVTAIFQLVTSSPGSVPRYWGFYSGDTEQKKKRYCLMCHVFKPDRTHHCSVCNVCVLQMDHHCPWINNCVGFHNRKLFMLLLFYSLLNVYLVSYALFPKAYLAYLRLQQNSSLTLQADLLTLGVESFVFALSIVLVRFSRFHLGLVLKNATTIEMLDPRTAGCYDLGTARNWRQVFGNNPWMWFLPVYGKSGKPAGDGVTWTSLPVVSGLNTPRSIVVPVSQASHLSKNGQNTDTDTVQQRMTPSNLRTPDMSMIALVNAT